MSPESNFPALPVRQRGTLEIIDTAMKLYRRYFGVLMGWSALTAVLMVLISLPTCGLGVLLAYPLVPGAGCCAIAAAVRGQRITFNQVWEFTKPRFGALILVTLLSGLLFSVAYGVVSLVWLAFSLGGTWFFSAINAPTEVTVVVAIIGTVVGLLVSSVLYMMAYAWMSLVPIIACLEDDKRSAAALGRAWDLMKGHWKRVLGLSTLLSIAVVAVMGIVGGSIALFGDGIGAFTDDASELAIIGVSLTFSAFIGLFLLFWNPIQTLVLAVLYLDLRVRNEALDLEWNSYASAPPAQTNAPEIAAAELANNSAAPELAPASMSGYAPGSSAPAIAATSSAPTPINDAPEQISLSKETSSFSAAPVAPQSAPVAPQSAPVAPQSAPLTPQSAPVAPQEAFDFSSSFSAGQTDGDESKRADNADEKS